MFWSDNIFNDMDPFYLTEAEDDNSNFTPPQRSNAGNNTEDQDDEEYSLDGAETNDPDGEGDAGNEPSEDDASTEEEDEDYSLGEDGEDGEGNQDQADAEEDNEDQQDQSGEAPPPDDGDGSDEDYSLDDDGGDDNGGEDTQQQDSGEEGTQDTGDDGESEGPDPRQKLRDLENSIFDQLSEDEKQRKTKELKDLFESAYFNCQKILASIDKVDKTPENVKVYEYVSNTINDLGTYIKDYLQNTFDNRTYIENATEFEKYIAVFDAIKNVFLEIKKQDDKK